MSSVFVNSLTFSDGSVISFDKNDIIVFVGPNNAGKSASLKEINKLIRSKHEPGRVIKDLHYSKVNNIEDFLSILESQARKYINDNTLTYYQGLGFNFHEGAIRANWESERGLGDITQILVNLLSTEVRLTASDAPENISLTKQAPTHPIHFLQKNDNIEKQFSNYFRQAFKQDLVVHRNAGNRVPLYIGDRPIVATGEDRVSVSYLEKLEKLPLLQEQGDGMRSFVGVLLNTFISNHSILLIDEPEAFLHPPQARLLGKMLGKDLPKGKQLFLSTHSEHFLKGLLDSNNGNLKIIRIQREGDINNVSILDSSDINSIWADSLLRHSNILDGLFHTKVVIVESDSDSRFYSALLDSIYDNTNDASPDVLFIHCGGKHRIPTVIKSLKKLNVPISVISDFDVLNDVKPIKEIFEELGGHWSDIQADWKTVKTSIDIQRPELETNDLKKQFSEILDKTHDRLFPKVTVSEIQKILKKTSAWSKAKEIGKSYIPGGAETQAYNRLSQRLEDVKLFIVEVGELECFAKSIGNHGPSWVNEVLTKNLKTDPELESARNFILKVIKP